MRTIIDDEAAEVIVETRGCESRYSLASAEGFAAVSRSLAPRGLGCQHVYSFTWMGLPIIQLPEDMVRAQEVIWHIKPDVLVETGVAHGWLSRLLCLVV